MSSHSDQHPSSTSLDAQSIAAEIEVTNNTSPSQIHVPVKVWLNISGNCDEDSLASLLGVSKNARQAAWQRHWRSLPLDFSELNEKNRSRPSKLEVLMRNNSVSSNKFEKAFPVKVDPRLVKEISLLSEDKWDVEKTLSSFANMGYGSQVFGRMMTELTSGSALTPSKSVLFPNVKCFTTTSSAMLSLILRDFPEGLASTPSVERRLMYEPEDDRMSIIASFLNPTRVLIVFEETFQYDDDEGLWLWSQSSLPAMTAVWPNASYRYRLPSGKELCDPTEEELDGATYVPEVSRSGSW